MFVFDISQVLVESKIIQELVIWYQTYRQGYIRSTRSRRRKHKEITHESETSRIDTQRDTTTTSSNTIVSSKSSFAKVADTDIENSDDEPIPSTLRSGR